MPRTLYRYLRDETVKNPNPIVVTPTKAVATSRQYKDDLLCTECEDRFNKNGESWVLKNGWRSETDFARQAALLARPPLFSSDPGFTVFAAAGDPAVDVDKLAYFAASILWRAGANDWSPVNGHTPVRLALGPYEERFRQ